MKIEKKKKRDDSVSVGYNPMKKIKFNFDISILNSFIGYIFSEDKAISKMNLSNLAKLIEMTDMRQYEINRKSYARMEFIQAALEGKLQKGIDKRDLLKAYCTKENDEDCVEILGQVDNYTGLSFQEIKYITESVSDRLKYCFIVAYKEMIMNQFMRIDTGDYESFKEITEEVKERCGLLMNEIRKAEQTNSNAMFTLNDEVFESLVANTVMESVNPSSVLVTGIQMLNEMLSPGYIAGRLYMFLGVTGGWKSVMLLSTCYWMKKYNKITPEIEGRRPTILYISNENSINESIVRLFNMSVTDDDISNFDPSEAAKLMREKGGLTLKGDDDIDIVMQYYGNMEISTSDLYGIIEDLEDDNREVICLVLDYIKRIRSAAKAVDERTRLSNASNELKDLAVRQRIPVITAQQINRAGNMTIDSAMESGKEDLAKYLGRGNIAESWDMLQNCDWAAILNIEVERSTEIRYLTVKEIKKRYRSQTQVTYMNQPFRSGSTIQLIEDFYDDKPAAKLSLASDLIGVNPKAELVQTKKGIAVNKDAIKDDPFGDMIK